ncbi:unnamed protein product [Rotaria sp. Silwood1]|nr:unnamed protein product [Rotaria sp. Silwood1]CAF1692152.1 unnamed protein product [Rotaria sp. Silwood1]
MAASDDTYENENILKLKLEIARYQLAIETEKRKGEEEKRKIEKEKRIQKKFDVIIEEERRKAEEEKRKAEEEKRKAEEERRKAEEEKRKAEEERRKAEEEKRKAEEEKRKAEEEKQKAEEEKRNAEEEKRKAEEEKRKQKELNREIELIKTKRMKITQELSSSSMINILTILSDHGSFYNLFVRDHLQSFDINNVLNDNNYLNENTIELIRIYINNVSSMSNANEQQIKSTFQDLILNLLNALNDCTLLKYLDIQALHRVIGKFCPDCCFLFKNVNIDTDREHKCLQDFIVCVGEFKKSDVSSEASIGQILHYLHLLSVIQNRKKIYGFLTNGKQISFFYIEKKHEWKESYNFYKSQDFDMFNEYSKESLSGDMMITNEEWKNKYLNEVTWKIFINFLTMNNKFYEYTTLNINPSDNLFQNKYNIRKKLGNGLTSMVYLLVKNDNNSLNDDIDQCVMKISKSSLYSEYFVELTYVFEENSECKF